MALLDEELVEYWLNNQGFFCIRGVKTGLGEMDFLAVRPGPTGLEAWHVEVHVSFKAIGYIGGDTNAKERPLEKILEGVESWIVKKYTHAKKVSRRGEILPNASWQYVFVCGEVREPLELEFMSERGIIIYRYRDVLSELVKGNTVVNSTAGTIVNILRYANKHGVFRD